MSVTIADILGANEEPEDDDEEDEVYVEGEGKDMLTRFAPIANEAVKKYLNNAEAVAHQGVAYIPIVTTSKDEPNEKWIFLVEVEAGVPIGMIAFPMEGLLVIFNTLQEIFNDYIKSTRDGS